MISDELLPGDQGTTFCGLELRVPRRRCTKTEWLWPTCQDCNELAKGHT